jgi:hypothetical protein
MYWTMPNILDLLDHDNQTKKSREDSNWMKTINENLSEQTCYQRTWTSAEFIIQTYRNSFIEKIEFRWGRLWNTDEIMCTSNLPWWSHYKIKSRILSLVISSQNQIKNLELADELIWNPKILFMNQTTFDHPNMFLQQNRRYGVFIKTLPHAMLNRSDKLQIRMIWFKMNFK